MVICVYVRRGCGALCVYVRRGCGALCVYVRRGCGDLCVYVRRGCGALCAYVRRGCGDLCVYVRRDFFNVCACCGGGRSQSGCKVSDFLSLTNIKHYSNWRLLQMQVVVVASPHTSRKGE